MDFKCLRLLISTIILANVIWGQSQQQPDFNGCWRLEPSQCVLHSHIPSQLIWQIEQTDDAIHLIQRYGDNKVDDLRCSTDGKDCKITDPGRAALISFYYNGSELVELEAEGGWNRDTVIRRRMSLSKHGARLIVDVTYEVPTGRAPERLAFSRAPATQRVQVQQ